MTQNQTELVQGMEDDSQEWLDSLDYINQEYGHAGVRAMLRNLQNHALRAGVALNETTGRFYTPSAITGRSRN